MGCGIGRSGRVSSGVRAKARRPINAARSVEWPKFLSFEVYPLEIQQGSASRSSTTWATILFGNGVDRNAFFIIRLPLGYKAAGIMRAKIMWWDDSLSSGNVKWQLEYEKKEQGDPTAFASSSTTSIVDGYSGSSGVNEIDITDSMGLTTTGWGPGDTIFFEVERLGTDGSDTYDEAVHLGQIQFEYEADRIGTPS